MKLVDAIRSAGIPPQDGAEPKSLALICGFTPLHIATFLNAHGRIRFPAGGVTVHTGLYGDLPENLARANSSVNTETALLIEWADLDPRLGFRTAGGWESSKRIDIVRTVEQTLNRLTAPLAHIAEKAVVAVSAPTLPLPPFGTTTLAQASLFELHLKR